MSRPAQAEVDLRALAHNARTLKGLCGGALLCAVVKADAYGHGAPQVALRLQEQGVDYFAVALVEEGVELREAGIDKPIMLLSQPEARYVPELLHFRLEPSVFSHQGLAALSEALEEQKVSGAGPLELHLKVDTGMHRLGCDPEEVRELVRAIAKSRGLRLKSVWSHLACADEEDERPTKIQAERFVEAVNKTQLPEGVLLHISNSAALMCYPELRYDMARCGISLYGHFPSAYVAKRCAGEVALRPVMALKAHLVHLRRIEAGESVSYGWSWSAGRPSLIGVVPLGYADGVPRDYGLRGGRVLVRGRFCPVVGVVTMDYFMVDLTDLAEEEAVEVGDEAVLMGESEGKAVTAEEWAQRLGTSPYEVLVRISKRVKRRYLG